jgi:hypothetical protein
MVRTVGRSPQYWHVYLSRRKISRFVSLTRGRGRCTMYDSRTMDGRGNADEAVLITPRPFSTAQFPLSIMPTARLVVQMLRGS